MAYIVRLTILAAGCFLLSIGTNWNVGVGVFLISYAQLLAVEANRRMK